MLVWFVLLSSVAPGLTSLLVRFVLLSSVAPGLTSVVSEVCVAVFCSTLAHFGC